MLSGLYKFSQPALFLIDPEKAHGLTLKALKAGLIPPCNVPHDPALEVTLWGKTFDNPVGLAAGFDKKAAVMGPILKLGFGHTEIGTVTPKAQPGNPQPRLFRDPAHHAVINRMGFPGDGLPPFKANLEAFRNNPNRPAGVIGVNIGMNKGQTDPASDFALLARELAPLADFLVFNVSCPNVKGVCDLQQREPFMDLAGKVMEAAKEACNGNPPPVIAKFGPNLSEAQQEELAKASLEAGIDGISLTNGSTARPDYLPKDFAAEQGGLSGDPVRDLATQSITNFYRLTGGKLPIIGLGGVSSGKDAYEKIKAGASLIQLYTGIVYQGPWVAAQINRDLLALMKADGYSHISEAVGADHRDSTTLKKAS
ncbi:MAG: quinone-dependent dihydroorotate dehydrogenase [Rhodospirillales bacterium]|nr:quinone-dependent dihydroorotate dehydrogenase [Rhodospirillales bacterium]